MIHCKIPQIAMKYTVTIRIFFFKTVTIVAWILDNQLIYRNRKINCAMVGMDESVVPVSMDPRPR